MQQRTDTTVWYKQFWPWLIIALPGSAVIAGIITVIIAFENADTLVRDDYYKDGLAINQELALDHRATEMGLQAVIDIDLEIGSVSLQLQPETPEPPAHLTLDFIHPVSSQRDFSVQLRHLARGHYAAELPQLLVGRWYLQLQPSESVDPWRLKAEVDLRRGGKLSLTPSAG